MRRILIVIGAVIVAQVGVLALIVWSGVYNVAASREHLPGVQWLLSWGLRNSIETHAMGITPPPLTERSLFYRGLGHYEGACSPCHGAPDERRNAVALRMLPRPPYLMDRVKEWTPAELFWIVKHGLKYTGMPGWPAPTRDDEIWAMIAFLLRLPDLRAEDYRRLARTGAAVDPLTGAGSAELIASAGPLGESLVACARCHGMRGMGGGEGAFPRLAGQKQEYLHQALLEYASGARHSGLMQAVASELSEAQMGELAQFYAGLKASSRPGSEAAPPEVLKLGSEIAARGTRDGKTPACANCHGVDGAAINNRPTFPAIGGQWADYLALRIRLFRDRAIGDTPSAKIMSAVVTRLTDEEIRAVAAYYARQAPTVAEPKAGEALE